MEKLNEAHNDTQNKDPSSDEKNKITGFTTAEALELLQRDIKNKIKEYEYECKITRKYRGWLKDALDHKSQYTTFCWISATALLISAVLLIASCWFGNNNDYTYCPYEGITIIVLVLINLYLVISDNKFRHFEILHGVKNIVKQLEAAKSICKWKPENYPHLYSPLSPCITLQWTYRDGQLINLPWALLVTGDIIVIKPGQQAPGYCIPFDDCEPKLQAREIYGPGQCSNSGASGSMFSAPQARIPMRSQIYKLLETPYLSSLQLALDEALDRPITVLNRERHLTMICCVEQIAYPILLGLLLLINLLRFLYLEEFVGTGHWSEMFVSQPIAVTLPLLPLAFPFWWLALNAFGMARFKALFKLYQSSKRTQFLDPFDESSDSNHPEVVYNWTELSGYFWDIFFGKENMMTRSANILHVLGSVTALCCIDKKGILSWPNPTAEKVFFLHHANANPISKASSVISENKLTESNPGKNVKPDSNRISYVPHESHAVAEVLDLTHDRSLPFKLQFDDHVWHQHINSLKPLGLAILLNTCNMETQEHYTQFCGHVTCEALQNENLVPVTNRSKDVSKMSIDSRETNKESKDKSGYEAKDNNFTLGSQQFNIEMGCLGETRCLCELAIQIGFKEQAKEVFHLDQQLSTYRHVPLETAKRDMKFAHSLKLKFPFPHMVAVIVRDKNGGTLQLLTQGTADLILDSCVEFWSGQDLSPLTDADKKKVQDFYHRMSLTSYCTAYAYRPLTRNVSNKLSNVYMELPSESKHLYVPYRSPTPLPFDFKNVLDPRIRGLIGQFHSTDSLLCEAKDEEVSTIETCFEMQCNQVFIGMVSMQYQAQADMVQLIEQLEQACIRFVHFSKENELRSRVFSEKMGLESGWNCHISLLSERARSESPIGWCPSNRTSSSPTASTRSLQPRRRYRNDHDDDDCRLINRSSLRSNLDNSRTMSLSAPSAINTEITTVKFDNEVTTNDYYPDKFDQTKNQTLRREQELLRSDDSVLMRSVDLGTGQDAWRSLSCLTDSTEQSAPVNFDMSNRAKLPRGIDNIRYHIDNIDNVPLLVSLFTDCNTTVTREMLHIMQDYGEIVCVLGSSANADNMPIFMQADAAIAVEPLYPQVCQRVPVLTSTKQEDGPSPIELSRSLNSVSCSLSVKREDPIAVYHLIMEARNYVKCLLNCLQFWLCCAITLALVQALAAFFLLPPLFNTSQVLWLCVLVLPLLSASLVGRPTDPSIMNRAAGVDQGAFDKQMAAFVIWCYGGKFLLTILTLLLWQGLSLRFLCSTYVQKLGIDCYYVYPNVTGNQEKLTWGGWSLRPDVLDTVQHIGLVIIVVHFVTVSASFVHREYFAWQKLPFQNWTWVLASLIVICLQAIFSGKAFCNYWKNENQRNQYYPSNLPYYFVVSLPLVFLINEFIKWQEMKVNIRYQKKARLQFTTKLGMNSPF